MMDKTFKAKTKKLVRGASRREQKKRWSFNMQGLSRVLYGLAGVAVFAGIIAGIGYAGGAVASMPVSRVQVNGEFKQVDKQLVERLVQPFLAAGFVTLDLDGIRNTLKQQPWIFDVSVTRQWPNEIVIGVEEQKVIARWGAIGFLNFRGELFLPEQTKTQWLNIQAMPLLDGPEGHSGDVMKHFRQLSDALMPYDLSLVALTLNDRGGWQGRFSNGTVIRMGNDDVMGKLRHFLNVYRGGLEKDFEKIEAIDLRHSQGFAVAWRQEQQST